MTKAPKLKPNWAGQFDTFEGWCDHASRWIGAEASPRDSVGNRQEAMCVDAIGRRCQIGKDFMRARDEKTFPIFFFWDCEPKSK